MNNFHGYQKKKSYFEGWYLKHQSKDLSIAFIPAFHIDKDERRTASIQVITKDNSYNFLFIKEEFFSSKDSFCVKIGKNTFSKQGIYVDLKNEQVEIFGAIYYSSFTPLRSDIMGPFHYIPFMQCNHGVLSMLHPIKGSLLINGKVYDFAGGLGYIEKDFGCSFPRFYTWTQCGGWSRKKDGSLMASVAHIPFGVFTFTGCICAIWYHGKEYWLATYLGAKIIKNTEHELVIKQGKYKLYIKRILSNKKKEVINIGEDAESGFKLYAPKEGSMERMIKENITCTVRYRFMISGNVIFDFVSDKASFESVQA